VDPHVVAPRPVRVPLRRQDGEADVGHLAKQGEERGLDTAYPWREGVRELYHVHGIPLRIAQQMRASSFNLLPVLARSRDTLSTTCL